MASHKIFVDLDEEIVFTVEKILEAPTQRVILVIPESANLVTSFVSLKLLARQINRSEKLTALVTEDKLGLQLAKKAGLVAKEKISDITPAVWVEAEKLKNEFLESRKELKNALIGARTESSDYTIVDDESGTEKEEGVDKGVAKAQDEGKKDEPEVGFAPATPNKPRLEPKVIDLGTVAVLGGGDIEQNLEFVPSLTHQVEEEKGHTQGEVNEEKETEEKPEPVKEVDPEVEDVEDLSEEEKKKQAILAAQKKRRQEMIGRDMSALIPSTSRPARVPRGRGGTGSGGLGIALYLKNIKDRITQFYTTGDRRIKFGVTAVVVLLFLFLMSNTVFASSSVTVYVSKQEVSVAEKVTGKTGISQVDAETLTLPVKEIKVSESSSNSANTTGSPNSGDKARGLVNIYNLQEKEVNLPAGTVLTAVTTGLKYKTLGSATLPKAQRIGSNIDIGVKEDVQVEAESFGEKYNTSGTKVFTVQGYTSEEVEARSFNDISGGTTSDNTSVSQKDMDDLKNGLVDELKNTLIRELEQLVSEDEQLIEGTIKYGEPKSTSDKKVGDEADTVNVTVELEATALVATKDDLKTVVAELIKRNSEFEGEVDTKQLKDPVISGVELANGSVSFNLAADGDITAGLTKEQLAKDLSGKSPGEAKTYLDGIDGVEEYEVSVGPFFLPGFLKKMPSEDKINIRIIEAR